MEKYLQRFSKKHPDYWKDYYKQRKEELLTRQKQYYQDNKEKIIKYAIEYQKEYSKKHPWQKTLKNIRQRCHYKFDIKYKSYGGKRIKCYITSKQIECLWKRDKASLMKQASIDRIDKNGHYTLKNCRFIEMEENRKRRMESFNDL